MDKQVEVKLSKTYKSSLANERKLKEYLHERYFSQMKQKHTPKL